MQVELLDHAYLYDFWKDLIGKLERAKGFEPSTPTLARLCSTPELHPLAPVISVRQALYGLTTLRLQQGN